MEQDSEHGVVKGDRRAASGAASQRGRGGWLREHTQSLMALTGRARDSAVSRRHVEHRGAPAPRAGRQNIRGTPLVREEGQLVVQKEIKISSYETTRVRRKKKHSRIYCTGS